MANLVTKPCKCGHVLEEIIGFQERVTDQEMIPRRVGWFCPKCFNIENAVGRETQVDKKNLLANKDKKRLEKVLHSQ